MRLPNAFNRPGRIVSVVLLASALAGFVGATVVAANEETPECFVSAPDLGEARRLYADTCEQPRIDCDRIDGLWYCSNKVIGDRAPGGVTADEVGGSSIGTPGTLVVTTAPPSTDPPATDPPATDPPATDPPVTAPPTTDAPSTSVIPTTVAPTTAPSTTATSVSSTTSGGGGGTVTGDRHTYAANDGPEVNPMKGWNTGWGNDRPEATVGFQYLKWKDFEPSNGTFDYDAVEKLIARPGSEGRHVILRLYCDWHGDSATSQGCPDWIYSQVGVKRIRGDNGRYLTDYNDPKYLAEAEQAIRALAARYDDDPRLYAFQLGVLGFWGEWHTFGSSIGGKSYEISDTSKARILNAYRTAFDRVHLMGRYPYRSVLDSTTDIGFHNDYFRPNNGHSAEFTEAVAAGQRWKEGPIGGEVPPGLSSNDYRELYAADKGREMIERGGYSTMKPGSVDSQYVDEYMALHKRFGYNYRIVDATFADSVAVSAGRLGVAMNVDNVGIAPFYFDWDVEFALLDAAGQPVSTAGAGGYDLRSHLPGQRRQITGSVSLSGVARGDYRMAVRISQPGAHQPKSQPWKLDARNTYVLFANNVGVVDGRWGSQNQLVGGWSILGTVSVG